jgi:hypothetical protein
MSRFAYRLCIAINLGIGLAVYAYVFLSMPGGNVDPLPQAKPQKVAALKPATPVAPAITPAKTPQDTITGSVNPSRDAVTEPIKPQAIRAQAAKIPGVRLAALGPQALPLTPRKRWTPAVGYDPVLAPARQAAPPTVRRPRRARAYRRPYYYARPSFSFGIGIPLRW